MLRRFPIRPVAAGALLSLVSAGTALAGASSTPIASYRPDPALRTASRGEIEGRFRRSCAGTQARLQGTSEAAVGRPCACYASRTLRALNEDELGAYRSTGVFNDTARAKALAAVDACKLERPV